MTSITPYLGLTLYNNTTDGSSLFQAFRSDLAGSSVTSNMYRIDTSASILNGSVVALRNITITTGSGVSGSGNLQSNIILSVDKTHNFTWSGSHIFNKPIRILGRTSGCTAIESSLIAGSTVVTLPSSSGSLALIPQWANYTPVWYSSGSIQPSIGNGILSGKYITIPPNICKMRIYMQSGSATVYGSGTWSFSSPFSAGASLYTTDFYLGNMHMRLPGVANYDRFPMLQASSSVIAAFNVVSGSEGNNISVISGSAPFVWSIGSYLTIQMEFET